MITGLWVALLLAIVVLEVLARRGTVHVVRLETLAGRWWARPVGRVLLLAAWAFVGVHLFCRYTIPA